MKWSRPLRENERTHPLAINLQIEILNFLDAFNWNLLLKNKNTKLTVADVGARTFSFAPAFEELLAGLGFSSELFGIELDAYRRFTNFHTRADYGHYYARQVEKGEYIVGDFLKWQKQCDVIFLLNPFVSVEPLLSWGLPLSNFKPVEIFRHAFDQLEDKFGILIVSSPTREECQEALRIAKAVGFKFVETQNWAPTSSSIQRQPRFGLALRS